MPKASVIGLGKSGIATARLLKREGWEVVLSDSNISPALTEQQRRLASENITVKLGHSLDLNNNHNGDLPDLIVVSPGVPWDIPLLTQARAMGIETMGEMELAWRYLQGSPWVGITGTNGKTTTTALIAAIFQAAGFNAPACGNIGYAACEVALSPKLPDWVIAEISSYQIESSSTLSPRVGIWTTFTPDHLARHKTLEKYYSIKAKLLTNSHFQILNGDDPYLHDKGITHWPHANWTSVKGKEFLLGEKGFYIEEGWVVEKLTPNSEPARVLSASALRMVGEHNRQNLLMAVGAARLADIAPDAIDTAIRRFSGVPHRLEHICTWEGIDFINDSKATNYDAAEVGLISVNSPAILIAGGEAKPGDDTGWLAQIQAKAAAVLLIGSAAPQFAQRLQQVGYTNYQIVQTMEKAVPRAAELAKKYQASVVLLSPACASFDQYPNFEARGDDFRHLCLAWVAD